MPPKDRPNEDVKARLKKRETCIRFEQTNPKKRGTLSATRYDRYKVARTVGEALDLGAIQGDMTYDQGRGFLHLVEPGAPVQARPVPGPLRSSPNSPVRARSVKFDGDTASPAALRPVAVSISASSSAHNSSSSSSPAALRPAAASASASSSTHTSSSSQQHVPHHPEPVSRENALSNNPAQTSALSTDAASAGALYAAAVMPPNVLTGLLSTTTTKPGGLLDRIQERRAVQKPTISQVPEKAEKPHVLATADKLKSSESNGELVAEQHSKDEDIDNALHSRPDHNLTDEEFAKALHEQINNDTPMHSNLFEDPNSRPLKIRRPNSSVVEELSKLDEIERKPSETNPMHESLHISAFLSLNPPEGARAETERAVSEQSMDASCETAVCNPLHVPELAAPASTSITESISRNVATAGRPIYTSPQGWSPSQSLQGWRPSQSCSLDKESNNGNKVVGVHSMSSPQMVVQAASSSSDSNPAGSEQRAQDPEQSTSSSSSTNLSTNIEVASSKVVEPEAHKLELADDVLEDLQAALADTPLDPPSDEEQPIDDNVQNNEEDISIHEGQTSNADDGAIALETGPDTIRLVLRLGIVKVKEEPPDEDTNAGVADAQERPEERGMNAGNREVNVLQMLQNCSRGEEVQAEMERERKALEDQNEMLAQAQTESYEAHEKDKRDREARKRMQVEAGDFDCLMSDHPDLMETLLQCEGVFECLAELDNRKLLWRYVQTQNLAKKWYKDAAENYFAQQREFLAGCIGCDAIKHVQEVVEKVEAAIFAMPETGQQGLWGAYVPEIFAGQARAHDDGLVELD